MNKTYEMWLELLGEKSRIEEIKRILQAPMASYDPQLGFRYLTIDGVTAKKIARQIYQLVKEWVNDLDRFG